MTSSTPTMTLTDFLLARVAEDEEAARATPQGVTFRVQSVDSPTANLITSHALRFNPARVLAECEAKRRIVEAAGITAMGATDVEWVEVGFMRKRAFYPSSLAILRALALPYADHPDYREEWAV